MRFEGHHGVPAASTASSWRTAARRQRGPGSRRARIWTAALWLALAAPFWILAADRLAAESADRPFQRIKDRHIDVSREAAAEAPRSEGDQPLVDGWPLYRTERGQAAFNDTMATLAATEGVAPNARSFGGCAGLNCKLSLPALREDGWLPAGRIWVSPTEYVLFVHSPRPDGGHGYRRRSARDMRYFVLHEFHNSTRNTDPFDTISSHAGSVFVPFYMSKQWTDAKGRTFVIVVQVAPYDVVSFHATNRGSAGPGMEVAKNMTEELEPLQGLAGILVATILKTAAPQLQVVNHAGNEGLPMLAQYERRLALLERNPGAPTVSLPFLPASAQRLASASARLEDLVMRRAGSAPIPVAQRAVVPPRHVATSASPPMRSASFAPEAEPVLVGPIRPAVRPPAPRAPTPTAPMLPPISVRDLPPGIVLAR